MQGIEIFQKPSYREICPMRGPPVCMFRFWRSDIISVFRKGSYPELTDFLRTFFPKAENL